MRAPDFVLVGAAKAGTTALHSYLAQHPQIAATQPKETFYFVREEIAACTGVGAVYAPRPMPRDAEDYARCFPARARDALRGESCVAYLYFPGAAGRIRAANPRCKILVMLREPAERAFSNYLHHLRDGLEPLPFRAAVAAASDRLREHWWFGFDYVGGSRYTPQLRRYYDVFPAEQIRVLWYEDFQRDPAATCRAIFVFLGIAPEVPLDTGATLNPSSIPRPGLRFVRTGLDALRPTLRRLIGRRRHNALRSRALDLISYKPILAPDDRRMVHALLHADTEALEAMTGRDLSSWLGGERAARAAPHAE